MIKKWNQFIREFLDNSNSLVDAKMQELKELIDSISNKSMIYEWENKEDHHLSVSFSTGDLSIKYEFNIDDLYVSKTAGDVIDFETNVESMDEGLDLIEKDIQSILGISENKIPKKYLTRKPKAMKKEIETFKGKKVYKKDWEADYDKRSNKRIKTKKSASTIAYQKKFGKN